MLPPVGPRYLNKTESRQPGTLTQPTRSLDQCAAFDHTTHINFPSSIPRGANICSPCFAAEGGKHLFISAVRYEETDQIRRRWCLRASHCWAISCTAIVALRRSTPPSLPLLRNARLGVDQCLARHPYCRFVCWYFRLPLLVRGQDAQHCGAQTRRAEPARLKARTLRSNMSHEIRMWMANEYRLA